MIYLDFDGVLIDSAAEAFEVGCRTWYKKPGNDLPAYLKNGFMALRPLVSSAWNYNIVFSILEKNIPIQEARHYLRDAVENGATFQDKDFESNFLETRRQWARENKKTWISSAPPFRFFYEIIPEMVLFSDTFTILSTKDKESIQEIIWFHFPALKNIRILGKETFELYQNSKANVINSDEEFHGKGLFVDDGEDHVRQARGIIGLDVILAGWGYVLEKNKNDNTNEVIRRVKQQLEN